MTARPADGVRAVLVAHQIVTAHGQALEVAQGALLGLDDDPWPSGLQRPVDWLRCRSTAAAILREAADRLDPLDAV